MRNGGSSMAVALLLFLVLLLELLDELFPGVFDFLFRGRLDGGSGPGRGRNSGRWLRGRRRRGRDGAGDGYDYRDNIIAIIALIEDAIGINCDAQPILAARNPSDVQPLAIQAFVIDVFPAGA